VVNISTSSITSGAIILNFNDPQNFIRDLLNPANPPVPMNFAKGDLDLTKVPARLITGVVEISLNTSVLQNAGTFLLTSQPLGKENNLPVINSGNISEVIANLSNTPTSFMIPGSWFGEFKVRVLPTVMNTDALEMSIKPETGTFPMNNNPRDIIMLLWSGMNQKVPSQTFEDAIPPEYELVYDDKVYDYRDLFGLVRNGRVLSNNLLSILTAELEKSKLTDIESRVTPIVSNVVGQQVKLTNTASGQFTRSTVVNEPKPDVFQDLPQDEALPVQTPLTIKYYAIYEYVLPAATSNSLNVNPGQLQAMNISNSEVLSTIFQNKYLSLSTKGKVFLGKPQSINYTPPFSEGIIKSN
jgi:hypothetical protein